MSVGYPPQNISFLPHNFLNNTWVYNTTSAFCFDGTTKDQCLTMRGGTYDPSESAMASEHPNVYAAGGDSDDTARAIGTHVWYNDWTTDRLKAGNTTLENFPIGMPGFDVGGIFDTQANIGLGRNSTLLNALRDEGHISSRTYSYWWGVNSASEANSMDGQLVLGGYDAAKVTGPNVTQRLLPSTGSCGSGMYLTVTNMILGFPNGTKADMLSPSIFTACIQLDFPAIASPRYNPFMQRFENMTGTSRDMASADVPWEVPAYRLDGQYGGDLTMVLDASTHFTLSNDVMILPRESVASNGAFETDSSAPGVLMTPTFGENDNDVIIIGRPFFSAAYIMVDLDAETWTLWKANATTDTRLVSVGGSCAEKPKVNTSPPQVPAPDGIKSNETASNTTNSTTSSDEPVTSAEESDTLTIGTIAGIVVGAVVGFGLMASALVWFWMRKRRTRKRSTSETDIALTKYGHDADQLAPICHEKPNSQVQELSSGNVDAYELPVNERPSEVPDGPWEKQAVELPATHTPKT